jgi:hypothetical protein
MTKLKVKFTTDATYDGGGIPQDARVFKAGKTYEMDPDSAGHWVSRRKAVYASEADEVATVTDPATIGVPTSGKLDAATKELIAQKEQEQAEAVAAAPVEVPEPPKLSAAEERNSRVGSEAELANAGLGTDDEVAKAVHAPPRDKTVKPMTTRRK